MYHPRVIAQRLEVWEKRYGFHPEPHSVSFVEGALSHFKELTDEDGRLVRDLQQEEIRFILNERAMCASDFYYYCTRYAHIRHYAGEGFIRFKPNIAQMIELDQWAQLEGMGRAIMVQNLKARQLGMSTISEIAIAHRAQFTPESWGIVGSNNPEKSEKMVHMMTDNWERMPWWLMPKVTREKKGELIEFGEQSTGVSISHGAATSGIGRGSTMNWFHLSELAEYINPAELVDASLLKAVHESPSVLGLLESTAAGKGNWWHKKWLDSKKYYWSGEGSAKFCPVFLPWFVGTDIYPTATWLQTRPVPVGWQPAELTVKHAERAREYVQSNPLLRKHLGEDWHMPREQMWYWQVEREDYARKDELGKFYQEMPASDDECFQSSAISIFSVDLLSEMREGAKRPIGVYGIVGPQSEIPKDQWPARSEVDDNMAPISITAKWSESQGKHEYTLLPLKMDRYPLMDMVGKLAIFEPPRADMAYGVGVDTGHGIGQDSTAIEVCRKGDFYRNDAQVAEWYSPFRGALDVWPIVMAIGTLYSPRAADGRNNQAKMVIECAANGEATQHELRKRGWSHFHQWVRYDSKRIDESRATKLGWYTNSWSRAMMLDNFIKAVRDRWVDINSERLLDEMSHFQKSDARAKLEAATGQHDDCLMAFGIVLWSLNAMVRRGAQPDPREKRDELRAALMTAPKWSAGAQARAGAPGGSGESMEHDWDDEAGDFVTDWGVEYGR